MCSLPDLRNKAETQLIDYRQRLSELPQALQVDASTEALTRITEFAQEFKHMVYGSGGDFFIDAASPNAIAANISSDSGKSFVQRNRAVYQLFKIGIRRTAPDFRPFLEWRKFQNPFASLHDEEDPDDVNTETEPRDLQDVRRAIKRCEVQQTLTILKYLILTQLLAMGTS